MGEGEEKSNEGQVTELEEGVEIMKLEEEIEDDSSVQAETTESSDKQEEV